MLTARRGRRADASFVDHDSYFCWQHEEGAWRGRLAVLNIKGHDVVAVVVVALVG